MALIPAASQVLTAFLASIVIGGLLCWIFPYLFNRLMETLF